MALFSKEKGGRGEEQEGCLSEPAGSPEARPMAGEAGKGQAIADDLNAYLGEGSSISGKLSFSGRVRLEGRVEGEISAQETLLIGEGAVVNAQIAGSAVIITGKVKGDITARKRVEIRAPGKVFGNVSTPILIIEEGVVFEGHCSMGGAEAERESKIARLPRDDKAGGTAVKS